MPSTVSSLPSHVEAHRSRNRGLLDAEAFRVAGAVVALVASALILAGGLLWRERERAREAPQGIEAPQAMEAPQPERAAATGGPRG